MLRRLSREISLEILFQKEFNSEFDLNASINYFKSVHKRDGQALEYSKYLVHGALEKIEDIDPMIQKYSKNWETSRMSAIDRNILRLAIFESIFASPQISPKIIINESLEIAKRFSSKDSASFINGILDQCFKNESILSDEVTES